MYGDGIGIEELEQCDGRSSLFVVVGVVAVLLPHVPIMLVPDLAFRQLGPRGFLHWNHRFFFFLPSLRLVLVVAVEAARRR